MEKVIIPSIKLNDGRDMPVLGYGTWLGFNEKFQFDITDAPKLVEALSYAIDIGYRHIDTAHFYRVEPEIGEVINKKIKEGVVKREELFVTTKVIIPSIKLNDGRDMPVLGYGTWLGFNEKFQFDITDAPKLVEALSYAIDIGYRHIDTAHFYRVEPEIGEVINKKIKEGVVKREELFVTTKVWNHDHREADVEKAVRASLRRMKLDYVDLVLIHWPMSISQEAVDEKIDYLETWRGFESVKAKGLAKSIGVSNFNIQQLERLLANCKVPPVCNQVEINLNFGQNELVNYCQSKNIVMVAYSPFGTMVPRKTAENDTPEPKLNNPVMVKIADKYGKSVTQIVLRYLYERNIVSIPKTVTKKRVLENASIFDFKLDKDDFETLSKFDVGYRTVKPVSWQNYENYPFEKVPLENVPEIPPCLLKWKNGANLDID